MYNEAVMSCLNLDDFPVITESNLFFCKIFDLTIDRNRFSSHMEDCSLH